MSTGPTVSGHLKDAGKLAYDQTKARWHLANDAITKKGFFTAVGDGSKAIWQKNPLGVIIGGTVLTGYVACTAVKGAHQRRIERERDADRSRENER